MNGACLSRKHSVTDSIVSALAQESPGDGLAFVESLPANIAFERDSRRETALKATAV
jgi:hypothetical protein